MAPGIEVPGRRIVLRSGYRPAARRPDIPFGRYSAPGDVGENRIPLERCRRCSASRVICTQLLLHSVSRNTSFLGRRIGKARSPDTPRGCWPRAPRSRPPPAGTLLEPRSGGEDDPVVGEPEAPDARCSWMRRSGEQHRRPPDAETLARAFPPRYNRPSGYRERRRAIRPLGSRRAAGE